MKYCILGIVITVIMFAGCTSIPDETAEIPDYEEVLIENESHVILYKIFQDRVDFQIEAISDSSNNMYGTYPNVDFANLYVDVNRNGKIDEMVDTGYSKKPGSPISICPFYIVNEKATTPCGKFTSKASLTGRFTESDFSDQKHVVWIFSIPKIELNDSAIADVFISIYESGRGYTVYPGDGSVSNRGKLSFQDTFSVSLDGSGAIEQSKPQKSASGNDPVPVRERVPISGVWEFVDANNEVWKLVMYNTFSVTRYEKGKPETERGAVGLRYEMIWDTESTGRIDFYWPGASDPDTIKFRVLQLDKDIILQVYDTDSVGNGDYLNTEIN